jgi:NADPH:quinone reductase-like Zn-dependent oxidoreductase
MPRAVLATDYGGPEVLRIAQIPAIEPGPGEVLLDVRAAAVNPWDCNVYGGAIGTDPAKLPLRIGSECAGVVSAVGAGVDRFAVGDKVIAHPVEGAYADQIVTTAHHIVPKPVHLPFEQAAGLLLTGTTAAHAVVAVDVAAGETVLVHGGAGGVGLMAIQLARHRGARVIATASDRNHGLLLHLGAEPVTYGDGLLARVASLANGGVQAAIDCVGAAEALEVSLALGIAKERIVTIANFQGAIETGIKSIGGGPGADPGTQIRRAAQPEIAQLAEDGVLTVVVAETFRLEDVAQAHRLQMGSHPAGKIVLLP